ncbi:hypothetical protein M8C21_024196 [Ambrosia artemisiifolia]|uniref:Dof zinc finger protein n=1 Tax=Ambrosia artemisiifolia TaxID=4212 RepID=A0AAD5C080_AMBAR|nr:hypothetical protein M8C21_024196 [Ambrosia artemisiifolia]
MVFPSVAPFLEHHNWHQQLQQQPNPQQENDGGGQNPNFQTGSIRPGSMVDRARLAKLPMPEPGLNCPRCDSTNTKFCYFNNYSLTQPRHFCKACRRYWTRGGALRNVPVGGGCRRNKRSNKNSRRSKSPSQKGTKSLNGSPSRCSNENMASTQLTHLPPLQMPFMSSYGGVASNMTSSTLGGFHPQSEIGNFHLGIGGSNGTNLNNILSIGSGESWRLPFLAGFEVPNNTNLFLYQSEGVVDAPASSMLENTQINPPVKVEENRDQNLPRQIMNISENTNQQPWQVGNNWAEFSGVSASSTPKQI